MSKVSEKWYFFTSQHSWINRAEKQEKVAQILNNTAASILFNSDSSDMPMDMDVNGIIQVLEKVFSEFEKVSVFTLPADIFENKVYVCSTFRVDLCDPDKIVKQFYAPKDCRHIAVYTVDVSGFDATIRASFIRDTL